MKQLWNIRKKGYGTIMRRGTMPEAIAEAENAWDTDIDPKDKDVTVEEVPEVHIPFGVRL